MDVLEQVTMMFGEHVATTLHGQGLLRINVEPEEGVDMPAPDFYRLRYKLNTDIIVPQMGHDLKLPRGVRISVLSHLRDAYQALCAGAFPGQIPKPSRYTWGRRPYGSVNADDLKYWTPERIAKFTDWKHCDFPTRANAKSHYTQLSALPEIMVRLSGCVATEVEAID